MFSALRQEFSCQAAKTFDVDKADRDVLGGWATQESDRCARVAKACIANVPRQVSASFSDTVRLKPISELEALDDFLLIHGEAWHRGS